MLSHLISLPHFFQSTMNFQIKRLPPWLQQICLIQRNLFRKNDLRQAKSSKRIDANLENHQNKHNEIRYHDRPWTEIDEGNKLPHKSRIILHAIVFVLQIHTYRKIS
jgi:hypothetical protein